jgi:two-component SAPR family response regulator
LQSIIAENIQYGLEFNSFEVIQELRTGLNLTPDKPFSFKKGFTLSFDFCFQSEHQRDFGYIFRMITQNGQYIDFVVNQTNLTLSHSENGIIAECSFEEINLDFDVYTSFEITIHPQKDSLNILIGNKEFFAKVASLTHFKTVNIVFGKSNRKRFLVSDVPRMLIKNISISNHRQERAYSWPLSKHIVDGVYDELKGRFASVENPLWILDKHAFWKKRVSFGMQNNPQISYDSKADHILFSDQTHFFVYDTKNHQLKNNKIMAGLPHSNRSNQMIYNQLTDSCYSYHFTLELGKDVVTFDTAKKVWNNHAFEKESVVDYWHHNRYISPADSCLYLFNGYGHHIYKSVVNKYNFSTKKWSAFNYKGDRISPRYLSGLGVVDDHRVLIFGGYGNETGAQELSTRNYYDLYQVDTKTMESQKLWEMPYQDNNFVVSNSMIVDTLSRCFYALCFSQQIYNNFLSLYKFSMDKPDYEILADKIPFKFEDIYSYVDLFLNQAKTELTAVTYSSVASESASEVAVYTLAFPPLQEKELYQKMQKSPSKLIIGCFLIVILLTGLGFMLYQQKKHTKEQSYSDDYEPITGIKPLYKRAEKQAIYLFGGFQTMDKNGHDITGEFSPMLKQLFLIIVLHTLKNGKGISSTMLRETLWYDKSEESAKNNRGVSMSKLRQIFELIGYIVLKKQNSLWVVEFGDEIHCDYYEALILMKRLKEGTNGEIKDLRRLLSIVSVGELLPNLQTEWVDPFKADFSNELIDLLFSLVKQNKPKLTPQEQVDLADAILIHDSLNEDALKLKCKLLVKMGKNGLAKKAYASFTKRYFLLFGTHFNDSFEQIVSG